MLSNFLAGMKTFVLSPDNAKLNLVRTTLSVSI